MTIATGIYKITNLENGKFYIGSAAGTGGFSKRWHKHNADFIKNKNSPYLQNAWNKYGSTQFKFEILLICERRECLYYEQKYLDNFKPWDHTIGYNICKVAGSVLGTKRSAVSRAKQSASRKGRPADNRGIPRTEAERTKISRSKQGQLLTQIHKNNISIGLKNSKNKYKRCIDRINPITGECKEYSSIKEACEEGFHRSSIIQVLNGKRKFCGGYFWTDT